MRKGFVLVAVLSMLFSCNSGNVGVTSSDSPEYSDLAFAMVQSAKDELATANTVNDVIDIEKHLTTALFDFFIEYEEEINNDSVNSEVFYARFDSLMSDFNSALEERKTEVPLFEQL
jgi:hypothetical protein